jgi:hypothetical protein
MNKISLEVDDHNKLSLFCINYNGDFSTVFKILHAITIDKNIHFSYQLMYNFIGLL